MFLWILALWVMDISQFAFMFPMSISIIEMNVYLSVLSEQFANWWHKLKIIIYELI